MKLPLSCLILNAMVIALILAFFPEKLNALAFFDLHRFKNIKNECETNLNCRSRKCVTRTDFLCAARSKYFLFIIFQRFAINIIFPIIRNDL